MSVEKQHFVPRQVGVASVTIEMRRLFEAGTFDPVAVMSPQLCDNGPINLVGALLVERNVQKYLHRIEQAQCKPNSSLLKPIEIASEVAIVGSATFSKSLHKNLCGHTNAGVIIEGPLSGLLITEFQLSKSEAPRPTSNPIRLFNDQVIPADPINLHPYYPFFIEKREDGIFPQHEIELLSDMYKIFKIDYVDFVLQVQQKLAKAKVSVREVFFELCRELQIHVDEEIFHFTQPINIYEDMKM